MILFLVLSIYITLIYVMVIGSGIITWFKRRSIDALIMMIFTLIPVVIHSVVTMVFIYRHWGTIVGLL